MKAVPYTDQFKQSWDQFVLNRSEATVAHQRAWRKIIHEGLGHEPHYLLAVEGSEVHGILPLFLTKTWWRAKYLVSIPWLDYGGILADSDEARAALVSAGHRLAEECGAKFVEYRSVNTVTDALPVRTEKVTFLLPLQQDVEALWSSLDGKLRNQIRKAMKSELTTEFGGLDKLPQFYKVFCWKMHQLGTPVWKYHVKKDDQVIAGGLVLFSGDQLYVPSASAYSQYLKLCPNHALYWDVIRLGCEQGYRWFDFGRSTVESNTYSFKKQWVADPTQLHWQYDLIRNFP